MLALLLLPSPSSKGLVESIAGWCRLLESNQIGCTIADSQKEGSMWRESVVVEVDAWVDSAGKRRLEEGESSAAAVKETTLVSDDQHHHS